MTVGDRECTKGMHITLEVGVPLPTVVAGPEGVVLYEVRLGDPTSWYVHNDPFDALEPELARCRCPRRSSTCRPGSPTAIRSSSSRERLHVGAHRRPCGSAVYGTVGEPNIRATLAPRMFALSSSEIAACSICASSAVVPPAALKDSVAEPFRPTHSATSR